MALNLWVQGDTYGTVTERNKYQPSQYSYQIKQKTKKVAMVVYAQHVKKWDKLHSDIFTQESLFREISSLVGQQASDYHCTGYH